MGTNQTTKETRRASYDAVIPKAKERRRSTHSTATEAVWRRKEVEHDSP